MKHVCTSEDKTVTVTAEISLKQSFEDRAKVLFDDIYRAVTKYERNKYEHE